jgi:hypothetical protein
VWLIPAIAISTPDQGEEKDCRLSAEVLLELCEINLEAVKRYSMAGQCGHADGFLQFLRLLRPHSWQGVSA